MAKKGCCILSSKSARLVASLGYVRLSFIAVIIFLFLFSATSSQDCNKGEVVKFPFNSSWDASNSFIRISVNSSYEDIGVEGFLSDGEVSLSLGPISVLEGWEAAQLHERELCRLDVYDAGGMLQKVLWVSVCS